MKISKTFVMSLVWLCMGAASAWSASISVTESVDFPDAGGPTLTLGAGSNTISGAVGGCPTCSGSDFKDNFVIDVPAGLIVDSASIQFLTITGVNGISPSGACFTNDGCFFTPAFSGFSFPGAPFSATVTSPYSFDIGGNPIAGSASYIVTVVTSLSTVPGSTVPEPSTWLLGGVGVAALMAVRHRGRL